jgi:putative DNA primase/helicase
MSSSTSIDFARLMGPVCLALLGEPQEKRRGGQEWRYRTRGSLRVMIDEGVFQDHEAGSDAKGGTLKLLHHVGGMDKPAALAWMRDKKIIEDQPKPQGKRQIVAIYDYLEAGGNLRFQVVRFDPKDFRQRRPDGNGGWIWKTAGTQLVPYRLPEVIAAVAAGRTIYIAEGEKGVHALESIGLVGTCSPGGAGNWRAEYNQVFVGADVVILPDNDPQATTPDGEPRWHPDGRPVLPGQDHAADVARNLSGVARRVRVVMLPGLPIKGDVADWVAAGGTADAMATIIAEAPDFEAAPELAEEIPEPPPWIDDPGYQQAQDSDPQARRRTIQVIAGKIAETATIAELALLDSGIPLYQRGQSLVRPAMQEVPASKGRSTIAACFAKLTRPGAVDIMARASEWTRFDGRAKKIVNIDPPPAIADVLLSRFGEWTFPTVKGVITTPTLRPDYSILCEPGYDAETRLYLMPDKALVMPDIPEHPTKEDAAEAIDLLTALLVNFPFVSEVDRSVALSALITPVCRGAMAVSPLHAFRANTAGTGKSFIADVASAITSGRPCPVISAGRNMDEMDKRLVGLLLSGSPIVSIDNVNGSIGSDLLCQAAERPLLRLRGLGKSDIIEVESNATIFANGNGFAVEGDMTRRTLVSDLDAEMERPELRTFDFDPVERVLANRGKYVAAALTVVRAFVQSGKKPDIPPLASYGDYTNAVRGALVWLGKADPAESMERAREDDPELSALRAVMTQWTQQIGLNVAATAKVFIQKAELHQRDDETGRQLPEYLNPELRDALLSIAAGRMGIDSAKFGYWLRAKKGRITTLPEAGRVRFEPAGVSHGSARWKLATVAAKGHSSLGQSP